MMAGTVPTALALLDKALKENERHYDSLRERSCLSYASKNYYKMIVDAAKMTAIRPDSYLGYSLCAIAQRELGQFEEALENHTKAINRSINDPELYNQRWKTHMLMGNNEQALLDARKSTELQPEKSAYHFNVFCALTALGSYDKAKADFEKIVKSDFQIQRHFRSVWSRKYVFETLKAGLTWYPTERKPPQRGVFLEMYDADEDYRQLAEKAELVVIDGFHPDWSPDGNKLVYTQGIVGSSGIAILNLESGKTRLLTIPGKDPEWSPDGKYVTYVRDRQILPYSHLVADRGLTQESSLREEVWLVKADGTENPRFLASGGWPQWSKDCKRIFYHSRVEKKLCSISIEEDAKPMPIIQCIYFQPAVSHDEKYVAFLSGWRYQVVELSSKSIVASWIGPFLISGDISGLQHEQKRGFSDSVFGPFIYDREKDNVSSVLASPSIQNVRLSPGETNKLAIVSRRWGRYPEDAENYYSRAKFYIYLKERGKASKDLDKFAEIIKDSAETARSYRWLATDLLQINPDITIELFRKAHDIQPENWAYLHGLGAAYYYAGQWEDAITNLTESTKFFGGEHSSNYLWPWHTGSRTKRAMQQTVITRPLSGWKTTEINGSVNLMERPSGYT